MASLHEPGKPHIFLLEPPDREKANAARYTRNSEALSEYSCLVDTIFPVVEARLVTVQALAGLEQAFHSKHKLVWETAGRYLVALSHYFPEVLERVLRLGGDASAQVRLRVVQSQWADSLPEPHLSVLLQRGLTDPSSRVRLFAAIRVQMFRIQALLPDLEVRIGLESNAAARTAIAEAVKALRAGAA